MHAQGEDNRQAWSQGTLSNARHTLGLQYLLSKHMGGALVDG